MVGAFSLGNATDVRELVHLAQVQDARIKRLG